MELQATLSSSIRTNWFSLFASFFWFAWFSSPLYNSPSNEFVKTAAYMGISQKFTQLCVLRISANNLLLEINFVTRVSDTKKKVNFAVNVRDGKSFRSLFDILWIRPRTGKKVCAQPAHRSITQLPDKNCQSINPPVNQTTKSDKGTQRAQNNSKGDVLSYWIFLSSHFHIFLIFHPRPYSPLTTFPTFPIHCSRIEKDRANRLIFNIFQSHIQS